MTLVEVEIGFVKGLVVCVGLRDRKSWDFATGFGQPESLIFIRNHWLS